jgi:hypothetical protein
LLAKSVRRAIAFKNYLSQMVLSMKYKIMDYKISAHRTIAFKRYRSERSLNMSHGWLDDKIEACRAITFKKGPSEGLLCSFKIIHSHENFHYFFHDLSFHDLSWDHILQNVALTNSFYNITL